jgi:hypothetical protein
MLTNAVLAGTMRLLTLLAFLCGCTLAYSDTPHGIDRGPKVAAKGVTSARVSSLVVQ